MQIDPTEITVAADATKFLTDRIGELIEKLNEAYALLDPFLARVVDANDQAALLGQQLDELRYRQNAKV